MFNIQSTLTNINSAARMIVVLRHAEKAPIKDISEDSLRGLTSDGVLATHALGSWLSKQPYDFEKIKTSPVSRCYKTAELLAQHIKTDRIETCSLLGDPGAYVIDPELAGNAFLNNSVRDIAEQLWQKKNIPGMSSLAQGSQRLLLAMNEDLEKADSNILYVSHDAILVPFISYCLREHFPTDEWVDYLQGFVLQFHSKNHLTFLFGNERITLEIANTEECLSAR